MLRMIVPIFYLKDGTGTALIIIIMIITCLIEIIEYGMIRKKIILHSFYKIVIGSPLSIYNYDSKFYFQLSTLIMFVLFNQLYQSL